MILDFRYKGEVERNYTYRFQNVPPSAFIPERVIIEIDPSQPQVHNIKELHFPQRTLAFYDAMTNVNGYHREISFFMGLSNNYRGETYEPDTKFKTSMVKLPRNKIGCGVIP